METAMTGTNVDFMPTATPVMMLVPWPVVLALAMDCTCTTNPHTHDEARPIPTAHRAVRTGS